MEIKDEFDQAKGSAKVEDGGRGSFYTSRICRLRAEWTIRRFQRLMMKAVIECAQPFH